MNEYELRTTITNILTLTPLEILPFLMVFIWLRAEVFLAASVIEYQIIEIPNGAYP